MPPNLQRFLGGSPGAVLVKLLFLSLVVGAVLSFLDLSPTALFWSLVDTLRSVFDLSFETLGEVGRWIVTGAVVVVPLWLLSRLFARR